MRAAIETGGFAAFAAKLPEPSTDPMAMS
jgi:hypothetical protein